MKRIVFAFSAALAVALVVLAAHRYQAQDRQKDAIEALARADAAFAEKRHSDAADDYRRAAEALPQGEGRDRAIARELVCLAEAGRHPEIEELAEDNGLERRAARVGSLDARVDYLRLAGLYFAGRDHDFHVHDRTGQRNYTLDWDKLGKEERWDWSYRNTVAQDVLAARGLIESAHDASHTWLETNPGAPAAKQQRHVAITMEYCDLLEVNDRLNGRTRNAMHFFGSDYGVGGNLPPEKPELEVEMPEDPDGPLEEDMPPARKPEETLPQAVAPEQEPFTRRGYFLQPEYPNLRTINALMETAASRSRDLKDPALQSAVLYRRAMLLMNVGLYGNAPLNAELTDWRNGAIAEPDISRDPRPLLRKLLADYKGSIWDDEARFLLGYVAYYLNDFASARAEFAQLEKDYPKSRYIGEARRLVQVIEFPQLFTSFSTGGSDNALVAPGQALSISLFARNVESVRVSLRPLDLGKVMAGAGNVSHAWADLAEIAKLPGFEAALGASVMDQSFHLGKDRPHFYQHREKLPLYTGTPGVFVLEVAGGPVLERKLVQIADLAVQRRRLAATEQFWVTTRDGRPLADVRIRGGYHENLHVSVPFRETVPVDPKDPRKGTEQVTRMRQERRVVEHAVVGATDNNGLYEADLPPHGIANFWATLDVDGRLYLINDPREPGEIQDPAPWEPRPLPAPVTDLKAFVYSDRPVYRPGDTAHLRIIARRPMGEGKLEGEPATLRVMADGVEQFRADVLLNEFGCATAKFEVPVGAPLGRYELLLRSPRIGEQQFKMQVLEYFKKDVKLEVDAPRVSLAPGSDATVDLLFSYHAGGAVQGAEVRYTVRARSADGKSWQPVAGNARTNMDGRVAVRLDTKKISDDAGGRGVELSISAEGTGPGGQTVHAVGTARISGSGIKVEAEWPQANWISGRRLSVRLHITDAEGRRLDATGTYNIWRVTDQTSLDPAQWGTPSLRHLGEWKFAHRDYTDNLELTLPPQTGRYVLELEGKAAGEDFKLEHNVLSIGQGELENRPFAVIPRLNQNDLATPVDVLVCQPVAGFFLLGAHADGRERGHLMIAGGPVGVYHFKLLDSDTPQVHLCARAVRNGVQQADQRAVAVRPASRAIVTTVRFDKERYRPGETATADVLTFDPQGRPVEAEVALAVWDSALKEFADSALERNLYDHFFSGSTQYSASDENLGRSTRVKPTRQNSARVKRWTTHAMPPGSFFYGAQSWTSSRTFGLLEMHEDSDKATVGGLKLVGSARESMDANWDPVPPSEGESPYYGESANQGIGGGGGSGGSGGFAYRRARGGGGMGRTNPPERKDFADSAYFNAAIRTSDKGIAQVSFKLPDNLTEWTFEATATDRGSAIGQASGAFKAARDLGVRMVGPRGLTDGDEIELSALVQNLSDSPASVNTEVLLNVEGSTAQLVFVTPPTPQTTSLDAGSAQEVRMRVRVSGTGVAMLKVSADSDDDADSLVWRYTVNPRGMFMTSTQTFRFDANGSKLDLKPEFPAGAVMDRSNVTLRFDGSLIGSVVDSLPGLVNYPHGCAEQTTNKFVPLLAVLSLLRAYKLDLFELGKARMAYDGPVQAENWPAELTNAVELQKMVDLGFGNLRRYQNYNGGWGWFGRDGSSPHLSATVLQGLCAARANARGLGLSLPASEAAMNHMFARGAAFAVKAAGAAGDDGALRARCLHAAALALTHLPAPEGEADPYKSLRADLRDALVVANARLTGGGAAELAALALALHHAGLKSQAEALAKKLVASGRDDGRGVIFSAGTRDELRWHDTPVEAQALAVQALAAITPAEAGLKRAVNALMSMRRDSGWGSTRATGSALQGLAAYLAASPEQAAEARVRIDVGGQNVGTFERTRDKLISGRTRWDIAGGQWQGKNLPVTLTRGGGGEVSGTMTVRAFMPVTGAVSAKDNGISVRRTYMRRTSVAREVEVEVQDQQGQVLRRYTETRIEHETSVLNGGETLKVGDVLTVVMWVKAGRGDKYICIEDARPSCLEPITSKYEQTPGRVRALGGLELTKEERDTSTNFYAENVDADGGLSFRYDCVVVAPGKFTALPARAFDMYDEGRHGHSETHMLEVK